MKISYNWLKQYLNVDLKAEIISQLLTDCGLEIEGVEHFQSIKGGLKGIVIGEVLTKEKHPDADRLNLTTVNVGDTILPIVCGAPNVEAGQKVVVAVPGAELFPVEGDSFTIKKSKIRGQVSEGMICAEDEIGLGKGHDGIMVLPQDTEAGLSASTFFDIENDIIFEIGLTPNRADSMSHYGVARDLKVAIAHSEYKSSNAALQLPSIKKISPSEVTLPIEITVTEQAACKRYCGVVINNVKITESPEWIKNRLKAIGLSPINNVVDTTNYVLHELGQPLHAFDYSKLAAHQINIKTVAQNTPFTTLDTVERKLSDNDLMICDAEKPLCIAGVFGGIDSGVTNDTTCIFLESAYFDAVWVRKTAKRHGLNTDASFRFERGVDPEMTLTALQRAANLICEIASGTIASETYDLYPEKIKGFEIEFSYAHCNRLIGVEISKEKIQEILTDLQIEIISKTDDGLQLLVPSFKTDVQREADVIEEILRIYGYNKIGLPTQLRSSISHRDFPDKGKITNVIADFLSSNGWYESMSNSLTKSDYYLKADEIKNTSLVKMLNPLSSELDVMRQSMIFGGLEAISRNVNRQNNDIKLYEFGKTYFKIEKGYKEKEHLALWMSGNIQSANWNEAAQKSDFFHVKTTVESILKKVGVYNGSASTQLTSNEYLQHGLDYFINKKQIASVGQINTDLLSKLDIKQTVFYIDIDWKYVIELTARVKTKYKPLPKYPSVRRDLALVVKQEIAFADIKKIAEQTERKILKNINLFDVYKGDKITKGMKSYAVSFTLQDEYKTLTDKQIEKTMSRVLQVLGDKLEAKLR